MKSESDKKRVLTIGFMMGATLIAKALGMLRGTIMANHYGASSPEAVAFSASVHIPLNFFDLLLGAAILGCFIPVYNTLNQKDGEADHFACIFLNIVILITGLLSILGVIFSPAIIQMMVPGLDPPVQKMAADLLRIMFPMIIFTGSAFTLVGIMQSKGRYFLPAMVSAVSNAGVIVYLLFFPRFGIFGLAAAYVAAWCVQFLTLAVPLAAGGFRYKPVLDIKNPALIRAVKMLPPIMIGSWLTPFSGTLGFYFASFVSIGGAVTIFDYSNVVYLLIAGILTHSICNYTFPKLSRVSGDGKEWAAAAQNALVSVLYIILPFVGAVMLLSGEGIAVIYMRGKFSPADATETANALRFMVIAMPAFGIVETASRIFYSKNMPKIPMTAAIAGIAANAASSAFLVWGGQSLLKVGAVGLGCAIGQWTAAIVLLYCLKSRSGGIVTALFWKKILKALICSALSAGVMAVIYRMIGNDPYQSAEIRNIVIVGITVVSGAGVYMILMKYLAGIGCEEKRT